MEIKAGKAIASDFLSGITWFKEISRELFTVGTIVYVDDTRQKRSGISILPWQAVAELIPY